MKNKYGKALFTENVSVTWSHLHKPDVKFGNPHHSLTVQLDDDLNDLLAETMKELGGKKINGMGENKEGVKTIKFKNVLKAKDGIQTFPCVDADAKQTKALPFGGDVCRVKVVPCLLERDESISFYLEGVQIVEKINNGITTGFEKVEGFRDEDLKDEASTPAVADNLPDEDLEDLPF
jgi:hypothetical protein